MDQIINYSTTNREGYREYKSNGHVCAGCPMLDRCTGSRNHVKVLTRHIWEDYMEICEDIRHTKTMKDIYDMRKETIERIFGTAKEHHGMRYAVSRGHDQIMMKVGLTFACMNIKKLVNILSKADDKYGPPGGRQRRSALLLEKLKDHLTRKAQTNSSFAWALSTVCPPA